MNKIYRFLVLTLLLCLGGMELIAQTNPTAQTIPYSQNFDGLTSYPEGWQGWTVSGSLSTTVSVAAPNGNQTVANNILNSSQSNSVGFYNSDRLGILSTGSAIRAIGLAINTTAKTGVTVKYNVATQRCATNGRVGSFYLQYRIGTSGNFTTITESVYENKLTVANTGTNGNFIDSTSRTIILPEVCNDKAVVQLRWIMSDKSGSNDRPGFSIDNIEITHAPLACEAPVSTITGLIADSKTENSIGLNWTNGNGAGRVIKMNTINSFTNLSDNANPTASLVYTNGEQVIYNGTGTGPITITGLLPNTAYYFKGYEYCSPDRVYNNSGVVESITTDVGSNIILTDAAVYGPFCTGSNHVINVSFDEVGNYNEDFKVQLSDSNGYFSTNTSVNIIGTGSASPITATIPLSTLAGSGYRVRVINADPITFGDDNGSDIVINATPTTPNSTIPSAVCEGNSIAVTGSGSTNALSYTFWDAVTGGNEVTTGVSGNTLTLGNSTPAGSYTYYIQGENGTCASERQSVTLVVNNTPDAPSGSFVYSANPSCGPATIGYDAGYYFQTNSSGTSTDYPTSSEYVLNSSGQIYVRALNGDCWSDAVASDAVVVSNPISISLQPTNKSIAENRADTFKITATNVDTYQWQENDGSGWSNLSGAITNSYIISNPSLSLNGHLYRVVLTPASSNCENDTSSVVTLTVTAPAPESIWSNPITGTSPNSSNPYTNGDTKDVNITVSGIGRSSAINGTNANDRYNTNGWVATELDTSKYVTWTITANTGYVVSLSSLNVNLRRSGSGPNKIQWRTSLDGFDSGAEINYTSTSNDVPFTFNINSNEVTSIEVRLYAYGTTNAGGTFSVNDFDFVGLVLPAQECELETPSGTFGYSANPSCGPATVTFDAGYYFQTIPTGTSTANPTADPYEVTTSGTVYIREFDGTCWSDALASDPIVINQAISISSHPASVSVPSNGVGSMSVAASNVSSYQWQENDGNGWSNIIGENTSELEFNSPDPSKNGYSYRVVLSASPCSSETSNAATLTVTAPQAGSFWSNPITGNSTSITSPYTSGQTLASNISVSGLMLTGAVKATANDRFNANSWNDGNPLDNYFSWTITPSTGFALDLNELSINLQSSGSGPDQIEVRTSIDNYASVLYSNTQAQSGNPVLHEIPFNITCVTMPFTVRLYASGGTTGTFSVNDFDFSGMVNTAAEIPSGSFSYSANPSCGSATIGYDAGYYFQTTATGTSFSSPTSSTYNLNSSGKVYVRSHNGTCWSDAVVSDSVTVTSPVNISSHPQNRTVSTLGNTTMSVNASNVVSYQWQENDGNGWENIAGATNSSLTFNQPSISKNGNTYRVVLTGNTPCSTVTSNSSTLTVIEPSGPCSAPSGLNTNVVGNQVTFNWSPTGADIHAIIMTNSSSGENVKAFSAISPGFTATIPSGSYTWKISSLCDTEALVTGNVSQWINGSTFIVP